MASAFTVYVLVAVSMLRASDGTEYELTVLPGAYMSSEKCEIARFFLERDEGSGTPRQARCQPVLVENLGEGGQQRGPKSASRKKEPDRMTDPARVGRKRAQQQEHSHAQPDAE